MNKATQRVRTKSSCRIQSETSLLVSLRMLYNRITRFDSNVHGGRMTASFTPLTPHIGAEIIGLAGGDFVTRTVADRCSDELARHGVLVFRDANLSDEDLVAFSRLLGQVVVQPTGEHKYPEIQTITLDPSKTNGLLAAYRRGNFLWHFDGAADLYPQRATLLSAQEIDASGGDTEFANAYAAYAALPEDEKSEIANLRVVHSVAAALERANPDASDEVQASWKRLPTR